MIYVQVYMGKEKCFRHGLNLKYRAYLRWILIFKLKTEKEGAFAKHNQFTK